MLLYLAVNLAIDLAISLDVDALIPTAGNIVENKSKAEA